MRFGSQLLNLFHELLVHPRQMQDLQAVLLMKPKRLLFIMQLPVLLLQEHLERVAFHDCRNGLRSALLPQPKPMYRWIVFPHGLLC